ncbi:cation diffusion facilitator family transporter [Burkholderia gladioli]|uniref:cation diffusion facilitator family transporter n=1 Tax=Burkholderia gladioli TaxID=28095 RepID=UPI00163FC77B|nr:cation transporter [Burkholderia gladioli]
MAAAVPRAVYYALVSNLAVAACKYAAAGYTNSGSAYAEAIHSSADCLNQILLLAGARAAATRPDAEHPLGFGRVNYFYAMLVATQIFIVGGLASAAVGALRLVHRSPVEHGGVVIAVLLISGVIETIALKASIGTIERRGRPGTLLRWMRGTGQPALLLAVIEDAAALGGILASLLAVSLALATGEPAYDAFGGIAVGLILMASAAFAMGKIKSLIVGESAHESTRHEMQAWLEHRPEVVRVISLVVLRWADEHVVAVQAVLRPHPSADALVRTINEIELALRESFPRARWIYFEPELHEHGRHPI